jgi:uncharacterized protein (UPF0548 family)
LNAFKEARMDRLTGPGWMALHVVVAVCVLFFVPLGLGALGRGRRLARWWPAVAVPVVVALSLPRGPVAALLCLPYLVACLAVPALLRRDRLSAFAAACLPVAAAGLAAERGGLNLLGFSSGVLGLTAAHFHVAGFGALLLIALTGTRHRLLAPAGVAVVGLGFLLGRTPLGRQAGDVIELLGAALLSAGLWLAVAARSARALLALSFVTMGLALLYAAGQVFDLPHLGLTWMALTHGVLNAAAVLVALTVAWAGRTQVWSHRRWSHRVGAGQARFEAASAALLGWDMHRGAGAWVAPETLPAGPGRQMLSSLGAGRLRLSEPCEVTEVVRDPDRTVMHYVALPGHTFEGDESFTIRLDPDGTVRFEVSVRSRPVHLVARLAGPLVGVAQWFFITRCAAALRRAAVAARR